MHWDVDTCLVKTGRELGGDVSAAAAAAGETSRGRGDEHAPGILTALETVTGSMEVDDAGPIVTGPCVVVWFGLAVAAEDAVRCSALR